MGCPSASFTSTGKFSRGVSDAYPLNWIVTQCLNCATSRVSPHTAPARKAVDKAKRHEHAFFIMFHSIQSAPPPLVNCEF